MTRALLVIDVQRDFTEKMDGGPDLARRITDYLREHRGDYDLVVASRDWHDAVGDNGGHFPAAPEGSADPYIRHCVAGSEGAAYDPSFDDSLVDVHVKKGQGIPGYSLFTGVTEDGIPFPQFVAERGIDRVTLVGLATDFCVRAGALDAADAGCEVDVLLDLCLGMTDESIARAVQEMEAAGVIVS